MSTRQSQIDKTYENVFSVYLKSILQVIMTGAFATCKILAIL